MESSFRITKLYRAAIKYCILPVGFVSFREVKRNSDLVFVNRYVDEQN